MNQLAWCLCGMFLLFGLRAQDAPDLAQPVEDSFLVRTEPDFTILYDPRVAADVPLAVEWVEKTLEKATDVYGVALDNETCGLQVMIYGASGPTTRPYDRKSITTGTAWYEACQKVWNDFQPYGIVRILGASAEHDRECCSALGTSFTDPENFIGVLVHEVMHHVQRLARNAIGDTEGRTGMQTWNFPTWFMEGMAEWEGKTRSTDHAQKEGLSQFVSVVDLHHRNKVQCCFSLGSGGISFTENYRTAAVFFLYIEATFGEEFIVELLNTEHATFEEAFLEQLEMANTSLVETFRDFQSWFVAQAPTEQEITLIPIARDREDAERLRRLIELLKDLLSMEARNKSG